MPNLASLHDGVKSERDDFGLRIGYQVCGFRQMLVPGAGLMAVVEKRSSREFVSAWDACCRRGWRSKIECSYGHRRIMHTQKEEA
jgi:hypothetical protein